MKFSVPTTDQVNAFLRHVYTAVGTGTAVLLAVGLSQGDATTIGNAVHQIGDGVAKIAAGIAALVPVVTGVWAALQASPLARLLALNKSGEVTKVVTVSGTATGAAADSIPGTKVVSAPAGSTVTVHQ